MKKHPALKDTCDTVLAKLSGSFALLAVGFVWIKELVGRQYAETGEIDVALLAEIGSPIIPEETYAKIVNGNASLNEKLKYNPKTI